MAGKISVLAAALLCASSVQTPSDLVNLWQREDHNCRGLSGSDPRSVAACAAREIYDRHLREIGWCYTYEGYRTRPWHKCVAGEH